MNTMVTSGPITKHVTYRAKPGCEAALLALVTRHWPTLRRLGLSTSEPPRIWRATDREGRVSFVEIFQWRDGDAPRIAHETPEVMAIWEPMGGLTLGIDLAEIEPIEVGVGGA